MSDRACACLFTATAKLSLASQHCALLFRELLISTTYYANLLLILHCLLRIGAVYEQSVIIACKAAEVCENERCKTGKHNKYSKDTNTKYSPYLSLIEEAKLKYKPCEEINCNCHAAVISEDLEIFKNGITKQMIENVRSKGTKYQIINHKLYRDKNCMFPARCDGVEHFLLKLMSKLPDTEFIVNTRDWPQIHKNYGVFGPVFSFSKTSDYHDIMYPAWSFWEGGPAISLHPRGIGRWDKQRMKLGQVANNTSWEKKIPIGFFRGSRTSSERDSLVQLSRENPDLVDAKYTKNQAWKSDADTLHQPPAAEVSFEDHCKFKYLFNFRGVAASFRLKHIFLCKSLVLHVGNEWLEFFYKALKPWVHYIPVQSNTDQAQLKDLLDFVLNNDEIVHEIATNGFNMVWNNVKMSDVECYWKKLLRKYSKLLMYKVELDESLIHIQ